MNRWSALALGSLAGGFARYLLAGAVYRAFGSEFPWGTLVVNLSGCLLIGLFDALIAKRLLLELEGRILLMTGFCGAFTTFSTLILESNHLLKGGHVGRAAANLGLSLALGLALLRLGGLLGESL